MHGVNEEILRLFDVLVFLLECEVDELLPFFQTLDRGFNVWALFVNFLEGFQSRNDDLHVVTVLKGSFEHLEEEVDFIFVVVYIVHELKSSDNVIQILVEFLGLTSNTIHPIHIVCQVINVIAQVVKITVNCDEVVSWLPRANNPFTMIKSAVNFLVLVEDVAFHLRILHANIFGSFEVELNAISNLE